MTNTLKMEAKPQELNENNELILTLREDSPYHPNNKRPVGRPTKMTPETIKKLEEAFLLGCTDEEACLVADISKVTLYNYQEEHPEFVNRKETLKQWPNYLARNTVIEGIKKDPELALKYLSKKKKDEFADRQEHTGKDGGAIKTEGISNDDFQRIISGFANRKSEDSGTPESI